MSVQRLTISIKVGADSIETSRILESRLSWEEVDMADIRATLQGMFEQSLGVITSPSGVVSRA